VKHQILDHASVYATSGGRKGNRFPVAGIQSKHNTHSMTVITEKFKSIGAPAGIAPYHGYSAGMRQGRPDACMAGQKKAIQTHNPVNSLVIYSLQAQGMEFLVQQGVHPAISVCWPFSHDFQHQRKQSGIFRLGIASWTDNWLFRYPFHKVGTGHSQSFSNAFHGISSPMGKGEREISFFSWARAIASRKISICMVFLPRRRSSSRIYFSTRALP